jgi:glycosyltransferase involved in cell wall biosynthesis
MTRTGPLRVAHVLPLYNGDGVDLTGGGERYAVKLAAAMDAEAGADVTLVTFGPRFQEGTAFGLRHLVLGALPNGQPDNPIPSSPLWRLTGFDLVHAYQFRCVVSSVLAVTCWSSRTPLVITDLGGGGRSPMNPAHLHRLVPGFTALSEFSRSLLPEPVRPRTRVLRGGIALERFPFDPSPRRPHVVQVSRIMPHKGMNYLVEAAGDDIEVTIAGRVVDTSYYDYLREQVRGRNVRFLIDPSDSEVVDLYRDAAVTVGPSVYTDVFGRHWPTSELLGLPMLESMAVGTPVVCTDVGGMPEYVVEGVTGFVVPPNDPAAIRDRILRILGDASLAARLGQAGHEHVQQFSWADLAGRTLAAYRTLGLAA